MSRSANNPAVEMGIGTYHMENVRFVTWIPDEKIIIGNYCSIAADVTICSGGGHRPELASTWPFEGFLLKKRNPTRSYKTTRNTVIGNDVWVGHGAHVVGGCQVGDGVVIGARAVVFSDVPPYAIVIGNPAKIVRYRFSQTTIDRMLRIAWWNWPIETIRERMEWFFRPIDEFVDQFDPVKQEGSP